MSLVKNIVATSVAIAALIGASQANATVINLDTLSGWNVQDQDGVLGSFYDNTFTTSLGAQVKVTDLFYWGDEYQYYINGSLIGSILASSPAGFEADPDVAYAGGKFASATFSLGAGDVLSFKATALPVGYSDGTIAVSVSRSGAVPEPATWALLIGGFGLVGTNLRRRRATSAA